MRISLSRSDKWLIFKLALILLLIGALYSDTVSRIAYICWSDDDYSHGLLLPFITLYVFWQYRTDTSFSERLARVKNQMSSISVSKTGIFLLVIGLFLLFTGQLSHSLFARWVSFFFVIVGTTKLIIAPAIASAIWAPILLIFMAKPLPDSLTVQIFWPLQVIAAKISAFVLEALHVPVFLMGNIIEIPHMRLLVEEACSGMRSVMALLTVAIIIPFLIPMSNLYKAALALAAIVLAVVLNVFRVAATGVLAHFYDKKAAEGFFHEFSGMIVFIVGLVILYSLVNIIERIMQKKETEA